MSGLKELWYVVSGVRNQEINDHSKDFGSYAAACRYAKSIVNQDTRKIAEVMLAYQYPDGYIAGKCYNEETFRGSNY